LKLPNPLVLINKTGSSFYITAFLIALAGSIWAFGVHTHNMFFVSSQPGVEPGDGMILTADDPSYLRPVENWIHYGVWKDNTQGVSAYIQRPPGMGIMHGLFYQLSPQHDAVLHKVFNMLLHFIALYLFGLAAFRLLGRTWALVAQSIYAILPCFWGYIFYFLTESITPSLLVILVYGYVQQAKDPGVKWMVFQAMVGGCLLLIRPQLGICMLPFFYFLWKYVQQPQKNRLWVGALSIILLMGGWMGWQVRSASIAGRWVGLHPIYDVTNNTQYRPVHRSFGQMFKVWEHKSQKFHGVMGYLWLASASADTGKTNVEPVLQVIPPRVFARVSKEKFAEIFSEYIAVNKELDIVNNLHSPLPGETSREIQLRLRVDSLTRVLHKKMWLETYLITPLHSAEWMFTKSQLNLGIFQKKYRGQGWVTLLRYICLFVIICSVCMSLVHLFFPKERVSFLLALAFVVYVLYLFFAQTMNEERYLMPWLPVLFLYALAGVKNLKLRLLKRT
jgi:4-amino-4-deoxy-L-arabinose transferase-like glycosyltransferase